MKTGNLVTSPEAAVASVFVTGATGYVGGRLVPALLAAGYPPLGKYLGGLARGVITHAGVLLSAAIILMYAGLYAGIAGTVVVGMLLTLFLLRMRVTIASVVAPLELTPSLSDGSSTNAQW